MAKHGYVPHIDIIVRAMRIGRDRLLGTGKIAVDARLLRSLIQLAVEHLPFDPVFYLATYSDIAQADAAGGIPDLHRHFIETGYFEGRLGAAPPFDEAFYMRTYRDVARALKQGDIASGREHYIRAGAAEGRAPSPALSTEVAFWSELLDSPVS
jgi:hypothetical protein